MNYVEQARSNYVRVKDERAFRMRMIDLGVSLETDGDGRFAMLMYEGIPSTAWVEDEDGGMDLVDVEFGDEVVKHLADGEVAIVVSVGYEGMRYLGGHAFAVNAKGERRDVDTDDIMKRLGDLTTDPDEVTLPTH